MNASDLMELEGAVVGAIMRRRSTLDDLPAGFTAETLSNEPWRKILAAILKLSREVPITDEPFDAALVAMEARLSDVERDTLAVSDGLASGDFAAQTKRLLEARRSERMERILDGATKALRAGKPTTEIASKLAALIAGDDLAPPMWSYWTDDFKAIVTLNENAAKSGGGRLKTGLAAIDRVLQILPGNVVVIAAAEKHGKTRLVRQIARNVAMREKRHVFCHSLEMTSQENVALDLADSLARPADRFFGDGPLSKEEWDALGPVLDRLAGDKDGQGWILTNSQHPTIDAVCLASERAHRKHPLALIVVDYLQLVDADVGKNGTRENVVSAVSRRLRRLASHLNVPIIALAQFSKEYARRGGKEDEPMPRPRASDLRESGAIAQDASAVCFIHNPLMNHPDEEKRTAGPWEFIVDRVRFGKPGVAEIWPDLKYARFLSCPPQSAPRVVRNWQPEREED